MGTHSVSNQAPPLEGYDVFGADPVLGGALSASGIDWATPELHDLGRRAGSAEAIAWGVAANANPPVLRTHDRYGNRLDAVDYHPAYHRLMEVAVGAGLHAAPWADPRPGAHVARAAGFYVWSQVEAGHGCPISMTYSVVPALAASAEASARWAPALVSRTYDPSSAPAAGKAGALAGMAMTEKQGGSDVRANTTSAAPEPGSGGYRLTGHKWFCSAPMSDLWLMLAQAPGGLSCFVVPRWAPDGTPNAVRLQRLKDKLGNRSNASSEIELEGAWGELLGEEGRGVPTIIEMVQHTRLDCVIGAAAGMRQAVAQATHHCAHRAAFGRRLTDQPLMRVVLADLAVESEAATAVMLRMAAAYDRSASTGPGGGGRGGGGPAAGGVGGGGDPHEGALRRIGTAVSKYWVCKRAPVVAAEALECLGGNGYVEESMMPRLFRESPLNGIWEGSGNVICLDVLRALAREPESVEAFVTELRLGGGVDARFDAALASLESSMLDLEGIEARARRVVEQMALLLQGSVLLRWGHPAVADAFCASRLAGDWGHALGTLPRGVDVDAIVARATPASAG